MTQEQINIAIAKACGWIEEEPWLNGRSCFSYKDNSISYGIEDIPDYYNDLNAMHEAEKIIPIESRFIYTSEIVVACTGGRLFMGEDNRIPIAFATASQKAEAFLRTLNLWQDDN